VRRLLLVALLAGCPRGGDNPKPPEPQGETHGRGDAQDRLLPVEDTGVTALPPAPPLPAVPAGLPAPPADPRVTPEAVALGELLFHDGRLSANGTRSCASCHDPAQTFAGDVARAADDKPNLRRTPALVNLAWAKAFGWDGRYTSLSALLPPHVKGQLGDPIETAAARVADVPGYALHLQRLASTQAVPPAALIVQALEAYVMTRYEGDAPWDRIERTALTQAGSASADPIVAGYQLFIGKGQCGVCHVPPLYTDHARHRVAPDPFRDPAHEDKGFKTPTLRGAATRRELFHAGTAKSLAHAVAQYNKPIVDADPIAAKIRLSPDEQAQIVAFLNALSVDRPPPAKPVLP
jgi:cytochrome c peroxidase